MELTHKIIRFICDKCKEQGYIVIEKGHEDSLDYFCKCGASYKKVCRLDILAEVEFNATTLFSLLWNGRSL